MVKKENNLSYKEIKGKKIRTHRLLLPIIVCSLLFIPFFLSAFIIEISLETFKVMTFTFLPILLIITLLVILDIFLGKVLCVLTEDKLYFFNQSLIQVNNSTGKKRKSCCDGSVEYRDIKNVKYIPAVYRWIGTRRQVTYPQHIILQGNDFQLTIIDGNKILSAKIRKAAALCENQKNIPNFDDLKHERNGLFDDVWELLKRDKAKNIFDSKTQICHLNQDESDNLVTLIVSQNGHEIIFNIDEEGVFMFSENSDTEKTVLFSHLSGIEDFCFQIKRFVDETTLN